MSKYNFNIPEDRIKGKVYFDKLYTGRKIVEIKHISETRTNTQNKALHLFFKLLADALNDSGHYFVYKGLYKDNVEIEWDYEMVKRHIWKPFQKYKLGIESTTELKKTGDIDKVLDIIFVYYGNKGIELTFPSRIEEYMDSKDY